MAFACHGFAQSTCLYTWIDAPLFTPLIACFGNLIAEVLALQFWIVCAHILQRWLHGGQDACFFYQSVFLNQFVQTRETAHIVAIDTYSPLELNDREYIILFTYLQIAIYGQNLGFIGNAAACLGQLQILEVSKIGVWNRDIMSHTTQIVIMPADILAIAGSFHVNFQTCITIVIDTVHHRFFGVLYTAITTAVTRKLRFPSIRLCKHAYNAQKGKDSFHNIIYLRCVISSELCQHDSCGNADV